MSKFSSSVTGCANLIPIMCGKWLKDVCTEFCIGLGTTKIEIDILSPDSVCISMVKALQTVDLDPKLKIQSCNHFLGNK